LQTQRGIFFHLNQDYHALAGMMPICMIFHKTDDDSSLYATLLWHCRYRPVTHEMRNDVEKGQDDMTWQLLFATSRQNRQASHQLTYKAVQQT
jgi:hypothetical protein